MFTSAAKTLLKNHIRHADTHNRMVEESEMWATHSKLSNLDNDRKSGNVDTARGRGGRANSKYDQGSRRPNHFQGRNNSQDSFLYDDRDDSESPEDRCGAYMDRQPSVPFVSSRNLDRFKKSRKTKQEQKAGNDRWDHGGFEKQNPSRIKGRDDERWGHSGYQLMYPGDFDSDHGKKRKRESYPKWSKKKKNKKRKKRNKHVSESEDEEDRKKKAEEEKIKAAEVTTKLGSLKQNSDLMLMQRFTSEVRPKKPSKPRMKMRTWNSDSSADSNSDRKYHKDKSRKYRSKKSRRKKYKSYSSSVDSSSDSESEGEHRHVKRKKAKKQKKKKRKYESDETSSDSEESFRSSRKKIRSSRTESVSESADSVEEYSDK